MTVNTLWHHRPARFVFDSKEADIHCNDGDKNGVNARKNNLTGKYVISKLPIPMKTLSSKLIIMQNQEPVYGRTKRSTSSGCGELCAREWTQ